MKRRIVKFPRARLIALAVGVGALASLAVAPAAFAAAPKPPAVGTNCQSDGKINGAGSTFQANAINDSFTFGYQQDVCGPQPTVSNLNTTWGTTDPSIFTFGSGPTTVDGMVGYNYSLSGTAASNGSGNGLRRLSCRTDAFAGTDLPYNNTQLGTPGSATTAGMDGPPGSESGGTAPQFNCDNGTLNTTAVPPPFGPQPSAGPWPATADVATNAMSFPVAGGAVAYASNLNGMCTNTLGTGGVAAIPTGLNITQTEFDGMWQGTINQWNDPSLVATDPILGAAEFASTTVTGGTNPAGSLTVASVAGYTPTGTIDVGGTDFAYTAVNAATNTFTGASIPANVAAGTTVAEVPDNCAGNITRVVREDNSGTTAITMFTLNGIDKNALCGTDSTTNWYTIATGSSNAGLWPGGCTDAAGHVAVAPAVPATSGSPAVITLTEGTNGGFGYAETGLWGTPPAGVSFINLQNSTGTAFVSPGAAAAKSNCTLPSGVPTGATPALAVGLGTPTWTNTGTPTAPGKQDIADTGAGYPACGLTFDLMYENQSEAGEVAGASGTAGCTGSSVITGACQTVGGPVAGLTNDQLRTMYSYFTYIFSPLAQSGATGAYLPAQTLDPLPAAWLAQLQAGFQQNF